MTETTSPDDLLTTDEACQYVGVSRSTLLKMIRKARTPRVCHGKRKLMGREVPALVRYRRSALDQMIEANSKQLR